MRFSLNKLVSVLSVFIYINFSRKKKIYIYIYIYIPETHYASCKYCGQNSAKKLTARISHGTHWNPTMHHIDIVSEQINFLWMCIIACIAPDVPKLWEFCRSALFLITSAGWELAVRSVSERWWIKSKGMREKRTKRQRYILHYIFKRAQRKKRPAEQMQMITHSHKPYGICQVDIHSCKAPTCISLIYRKAFFFFFTISRLERG